MIFNLFVSLVLGVTLASGTLSFDRPVGSTATYANIDKKGRTTSLSVEKVESIEHAGDRTIYIVSETILDTDGTVRIDDDGKPLSQIKHKIVVSSDLNIEWIDFDELIPPEQRAEGVAFVTEGEQPGYPRHPVVGSLPDNDIVFKVGDKENRVSFSIAVRSRNRAVVGRENVTTEAGTFDCWKFYEQTTVAFGIFKATTYENQWWVDGVGRVKTQELDKRGRVESTTVLIALDSN